MRDEPSPPPPPPNPGGGGEEGGRGGGWAGGGGRGGGGGGGGGGPGGFVAGLDVAGADEADPDGLLRVNPRRDATVLTVAYAEEVLVEGPHPRPLSQAWERGDGHHPGPLPRGEGA